VSKSKLRSSASRTRNVQDGAPGTRVQIMDTTLRDGEQTPDVSYTPAEKLQIARVLLSDVRVDRIEIAQTRVSEGERLAARRVAEWARKEGVAGRVEIMGYCDGDLSVRWIKAAGGRVMNLLTKGSEKHCREQLRQTPEQHHKRVAETILAAHKARIAVNVYLEDWSNGVRDSFDYVFAMVQALRDLPVERIYLPDTLGAFSPEETTRYVGLMVDTWRDLHFEFHAHNDYGLAVANCLAAVRAGARGVHTSVNGMGERAGNTRLAEVVAALHDHTPYRTGVNEAVLVDVSRLVETFSGKTVSANSPVVGRDVFTQTGGIHADGDAKGDLYANRLVPKRFGRARQYALGKLSGKASLLHNLKALGIELSESERTQVLERIVALGDKKSEVAVSDLPYIIADVLNRPEQRPVRVASYRVVVDSKGLPEAEVEVTLRGEASVAKASGDGGYDAFMRALEKAVKRFGLALPRLVDYRVRIPPGGRTGALVQTVITWQDPSDREGTFSTLAVDSDQLAAAVLATEKMLNAVATRKKA
jgi:D-citramalate synthase